jgi:hypothetical protein
MACHCNTGWFGGPCFIILLGLARNRCSAPSNYDCSTRSDAEYCCVVLLDLCEQEAGGIGVIFVNSKLTDWHAKLLFKKQPRL